MKRNIAFWTRYTWESAYATLAVVAIFSVLLAVGADGIQWTLLASVLPYLLVAVAMLMVVILNTSSHVLYIPLLISMGETRRNVFLGFQYYRALIILVTLALCGLIWGLIPGEVSAAGLRSLPTMAVSMVLASALGGILGMAYVKWRWVTVAFMVVIGMAGGFFGGFVGSGAADFLNGSMLELTSLLEKTPVWLVLAALAALAADMILQWMLLRRREVRL